MAQTVPESAVVENVNRAFPDQAQVVVIGGGIVGCSVAYHLTQARLARRRPARAQAAHLGHDLARGRPRHPAARHVQHEHAGQVQRGALPELERLTGQGTGFRTTGSILLATTEERWAEVRRQISMARDLRLRGPPHQRPGGGRDVAAPGSDRTSSARRTCPADGDRQPHRRDPGARRRGPAGRRARSSSTPP